MKIKFIIVLVLFSIGSVSAQMKKWTLQECVEYAYENNLSIEQFELDLEAVHLDKSDAIGGFLPSLSGSSTVSGNTGLSFDPTNNQPVTTTILTASGGLSSSVVLYDGLRSFHRLNRAKLAALASQYRLEDLKDDIGLAVANAYLQILLNKESLIVFEAQFAVTKQDLKRTMELVDSGVVPKGDLLEVEATAATQEQLIVNAENLIFISRINLAQLLQITDYDNFDVVDQEYMVPPSNILDNSPKTIFDKALTFRNDIKLSESNVDVAEKDLDISKGALYPTLRGFFNYNTRYSDQPTFDSNTNTFMTTSFGDQLWMNDGISYGAQLTIPIFNGFSVKNNIKRAEINVDRSRLQLEQDKLALEANVNQAYADVKNSYKSYEASQKTLEARRTAYEYTRERFEVGLMNAFDFSQSQSRVDNAEAEVIRSKYDYIFRLKVLEFYFGIPITVN